MQQRLDFRIVKGTMSGQGSKAKQSSKVLGPSVVSPLDGKKKPLQKTFVDSKKAEDFCKKMNGMLRQEGLVGVTNWWFGQKKNQVPVIQEVGADSCDTNYTLRSALVKFFDAMKEEVALDHLSESTVENHRVVLVVPYLNKLGLVDEPIISVRKSAVEGFLNQEEKRGLVASTRTTQLASIHKFFAWFLDFQANENDKRIPTGKDPVRWLDVNPASKVKVYAGRLDTSAVGGVQKGEYRVKAFSEAQIEAMEKAMEGFSPHVKPIWRFMLGTGCRPGEAVGLIWDHVKFNEEERSAVVWIHTHSKHGGSFRTKSKNGSDRKFTVTGEVYDILENRRNATYGVGFVFRQIRNKEKHLSRKALTDIISRIKEVANLGLSEDEQIAGGATAVGTLT